MFNQQDKEGTRSTCSRNRRKKRELFRQTEGLQDNKNMTTANYTFWDPPSARVGEGGAFVAGLLSGFGCLKRRISNSAPRRTHVRHHISRSKRRRVSDHPDFGIGVLFIFKIFTKITFFQQNLEQHNQRVIFSHRPFLLPHHGEKMISGMGMTMRQLGSKGLKSFFICMRYVIMSRIRVVVFWFRWNAWALGKTFDFLCIISCHPTNKFASFWSYQPPSFHPNRCFIESIYT